MRRGFTLYELLIAIASLGLLLGILLPALQSSRGTARQVKDASQIRGVTQSFFVWAADWDDRYPLPSRVDRRGATLGVDPRDPAAMLEMDVTRNIYSMLLRNRYFTPEMLVSPSEVGMIEAIGDYQYAVPEIAADPEKAMWDPSFRGVGSDEVLDAEREIRGLGHMSYAHMPAFGNRRGEKWAPFRDPFAPMTALMGNRGPAYDVVGEGADQGWRLVGADRVSNGPSFSVPVGEASNTLLIHGKPDRWEGNIASNDGAVLYHENPVPEERLFEFRGIRGGMMLTDNLFENENDETRAPDSRTVVLQPRGVRGGNVNNYLRAYSDAGTRVEDGGVRITIGAFFD